MTTCLLLHETTQHAFSTVYGWVSNHSDDHDLYDEEQKAAMIANKLVPEGGYWRDADVALTAQERFYALPDKPTYEQLRTALDEAVATHEADCADPEWADEGFMIGRGEYLAFAETAFEWRDLAMVKAVLTSYWGHDF